MPEQEMAEADDEHWEADEEDREAAQDLRQYGIYRALPVSGEPDFDSGPPSSAEEYLRRVRYGLIHLQSSEESKTALEL